MFSQCVMVVITLVGSGAGHGRNRAEGRCEAGLFLYWVVFVAQSGIRLDL